MPSPSGSPRSRMIRSGLWVPAVARPWRMVSASATLQPSASSAVRTKRRICRSSSIRMARGEDSAMRRCLRLGRRRRRGGIAEGQRESDPGTAARAIHADDPALMRLDERTRNGETESHAGRRRLALAAGEFLEDRLLPTLGKAGAVIGYRDLEP